MNLQRRCLLTYFHMNTIVIELPYRNIVLVLLCFIILQFARFELKNGITAEVISSVRDD